MGLQYIKKTEKYGAVSITIPGQKGYAVTHQFKGQPFTFFKDRGLIIGKGVRSTYDNQGVLVADYSWEDVVEHFKSMGFKIEHLGAKPEPKKEIPKPDKVEEKKESKK